MFSTPHARTRLCAVLLVATTFVAYLPAWHGLFLWDDDSWTTGINDLRQSGGGLWRMWADPRALQQYYPLTGTSFWLDYHLWGDWTLPYHLENVALHAGAALLFWRLLVRWRVPGAGLAAGIFALHPLMVESVAWITERKNVLSLGFFLAALLVYSRFAGDWEGPPPASAPADPAERRGRAGWYVAALACFLAALTAKVTAFSLPAVLLLLGWWRRGRVRWRADVLPTLPFFALSAGFALAVALLERNHAGAQGADFALGPVERCLLAGRVFWFYAGKLVWPAHQSFIYPRWHLDSVSPAQWFGLLAACAALLGVFLARHRLGRGPAAAVFFYAGTLFPVLGFFNGYYMLYSYVWDHLAYLSSLGLIALAAAGITRAAAVLAGARWSTASAALVLPVLAGLTWRQSAAYRDVFTLYRTTIRENPAAWLAYENLGSALVARGEMAEGIEMYQKSLALRPANPEAHNNLANAYARSGRWPEAVAQYQAALNLDPGLTGIHANYAVVLTQLGRLDEAIAHYRLAANTGRDPGTALANLADALRRKGDDREAVARFMQALTLRPADPAVANELAFLLATTADPRLRDPVHALRLAERLTAGTGGADPRLLRTRAAAEAASGQFPAAVDTAQHALERSTSTGDEPLSAALRADLDSYRAGQTLVHPDFL